MFSLQENEEKKKRLLSWTILISASLFYQFALFQMNMFATIGESYYKQIHISDANDIGWILSAVFYTQVLFSVPMGILLDFVSIRKVLIVSSLCSIFGLIGTFVAGDFYSSLLFRILSGGAITSAFFCCMKLSVLWFSQRKRAFAITVSVSIAMLGNIVAQYPLKVFMDHFGYDTTKEVIIFYSLFILLVVVLTVKEPKQKSVFVVWTKARIFQEFKSIINIFTVRNILYSSMYSACMNIPVVIIGAGWSNNFLSSKINISVSEVSSLNALFFIGLFAGGPCLGKIANSVINQKRVMLSSSALCLLCLLLFLFVKIELSIIVMSVAMIFFGMMISAQAVGYAVLSESSDKNAIGKVYGVAGTVIMLVAAMSQNFCGLFTNYLSGSFSFSANPAAVIIALFGVGVSVIFVLKIKIRRG